MTDPFLHPQEILIDDIARLSSTLSICGSIYVLFTWFLFTDLHFFSRKLIVYIAIADLGSSIAFISGTYIGAYPEGKQCAFTMYHTGCCTTVLLPLFLYLDRLLVRLSVSDSS